MSATPVATRAQRPPRPAPIGDSPSQWRLRHRVALGFTWFCGIFVCVVAASILGYMAYRGLQYLRPDLLVTRPQPGFTSSDVGGILDPIIGTLLISFIAITFALPLGVISAIWIVEYGKPKGLARVIESGIEVVAGTPDIVLAIFGLAIFQLPIMAPLSFTSSGGGVFGRSFIAAGLIMSLIALPLIFTATREGLMSLPMRLREGSWALGKTRIGTIRKILLPQIRPDIATGTVLGLGRTVGDTAIVVVLLGATLQIESQGPLPGLNILRGTGGTLTTYIYGTSPAGEANAPEKAYAAAAVLLVLVLAINAVAARIGRRSSKMESSV
jgi:phosphate transport system permease protein